MTVQELSGRVRDWMVRRDGPLTRELHKVDDGLGLVPRTQLADGTVRSVCGFCSTGCSLETQVRDGRAVGLRPAGSYPVNRGAACPKGWEALTPLRAHDRATTPLLRDESGERRPVSWDQANATFTERMREIVDESGPEAIAFLGTGQISSEELLFLGAFAKFGMGMVHGDGNTRQCMATSVVAYKESFGFDAPPYTYADLEESDTLFFVGANPCVAHPILWERVCRNQRSPEIIVVDPRRTETAAAASRHVRLQPKSDLLLFYAIAHVLIERDWIDHDFVHDHTYGFDAFRTHVSPFRPDKVEAVTGVSAAEIEGLAETIHRSERVSFWWTMGVNQGHEAVATAQALIDLALMTGNIGRPGTGANSITGQCNAMGSRLFSNTASLFCGRDFTSEVDRSEVAEILDIDANRIPDQPSLAYDEIIEAIDRGEIRGLWIVATNTAHSWIDRHALEQTLSKLDFLVVQDMYHDTDTARLADLMLPAAGWGEKSGTFINSERRVGRIQAASPPPGEARTDFEIFRGLARAWGNDDLAELWKKPADAFATMRELSRGRPCDITGIRDYEMLDASGGVQWPWPEDGMGSEPATERRLFEDRSFFRPNGRAAFRFADPAPLPEPPDSRYPLVLLTGRESAAEWHTGTRTTKSPVLRKLCRNGITLEMSHDDATALGIEPGQAVEVRSRRGSLIATAVPGGTVSPGQVFVSMHHPETNRLTRAEFDPRSHQPSFKHCAVAVQPIAKAPRS